MVRSNTYFLIPIDQVPNNAAYSIWFVTWSKEDTSFCVSTERPASPDTICPWAVVAASGFPKGEVTVLGESGGKDLPPPLDPPLKLQLKSGSPSQAAFKAEFVQWLTVRNDEEKPGT